MHSGSQWSAPFRLEWHQVNCLRASSYRYKVGPYRSKPRFYELLAPLGVVVAPEHRYYPYRATFDLEACLVPVSVGTFTSWRIPMSVSLVDDMISCLWDMSDTAYRLMREAMDPYCSQLDDLSFCHDKETECTWDLEEAETEVGRMLSSSPGTRALTRGWLSLEQWMQCMPLVSFNGGRYDLQLIKPLVSRRLWDLWTALASSLSG